MFVDLNHTLDNVFEELVPQLLVLAAEQAEEQRHDCHGLQLGSVPHQDECLRQ